MSRMPMPPMQPPPLPPLANVQLMNPPIPSLSPFLAVLYTQFLNKNVWLEFFVFSAVWNTLTANASGQLPTTPPTIDPSIDFLVMQMNLSSFSAAGTPVQTPDYLLEITESAGRNAWGDGPIHVENWTGQSRDAGSRVFDLPFVRYVRGNNNLTMKLTNLTATAARVDLALVGLRVQYTNISREALFSVPF